MARRKLGESNIRKIIKLGIQSLVVTIPIEIARALKLREKQKVTVRKSGKKIIIEDWPSKRKIKRRFGKI